MGSCCRASRPVLFPKEGETELLIAINIVGKQLGALSSLKIYFFGMGFILSRFCCADNLATQLYALKHGAYPLLAGHFLVSDLARERKTIGSGPAQGNFTKKGLTKDSGKALFFLFGNECRKINYSASGLS